MNQLRYQSPAAHKIMQHARKTYRQRGYLFSGPLTAPEVAKRFGTDVLGTLAKLQELCRKRRLVQQECQEPTFVLPAHERAALIKAHGLASKWQREAEFFQPNNPDCGEVAIVMQEIRTK